MEDAHERQPSGRRLGVAIVGAGRVAELHERSLRAMPDAELIGVYDVRHEVTSQRAREWGVRAYASLDELLADDAAEAILVLTHLEGHLPVARAALEAGRHVFIEKPVSTDAEGIAELARFASARGLVAMPGHNYVHVPEFERLHALVARGDLGTVRALFIHYVIRHPEAVVAGLAGILSEVMVHHTYLALSLLGPPERIHAGRAEPAWERHTEEDQAWMTWEYPGGLSAHLFASFAMDDHSSAPWTFLVRVLGSEGTAEMNWRSAIFSRAIGTLSFAMPAYEESFGRELRAFHDAIRLGRPLMSGLEDAATAARILAAAHAAATEHRAVRPLEAAAPPEGNGA